MKSIKFQKSMQNIFTLVILVLSITSVLALTNTKITVDFLEGSGIGYFKELGFYKIVNGELVRTKITSSYDLREVPGEKTYIVKGAFSTAQMYVKSELNGVSYYWYTESQYNPNGEKHFQSGNNFFWFEQSSCSGCDCNFDDYGFKLISISQYDVTCNCDSDCGTDSVINKFCNGNNLYELISEKRCLNPGTQYSTCSSVSKTNLLVSCLYGCEDAKCTEYQDTTPPQVELLSPENNSRHTSSITFEYKATDDEAIDRCYLAINSYVIDTKTDIVNGETYSYTLTTPIVGENTAQVSCYDTSGNYGASNIITFYYDEESPTQECSYVRDCGTRQTEYFCDGNNLMKKVTRPSCVEGKCESTTSESLVRECSRGCYNGRCISSGSSKKQKTCDTLDCTPIINFEKKQTPLFDGVIYLDEGTKKTQKKSGFISFDNYILSLVLLIIAIIIVLLLIIIYVSKDSQKSYKYYHDEQQYYNNPVNKDYSYDSKV